jgi:hypothetical protein
MTNAEIEQLKAELAALKADVAANRKKGVDMLIAQLKIGNIPAKIKMAEATLAQKDVQVVRTLIADARKEVAPVAKENFNKQSGEILLKLKESIAKAKQDIASGNKKEAIEIYQKIVAAFPALDSEQKQELLPECKAILAALR